MVDDGKSKSNSTFELTGLLLVVLLILRRDIFFTLDGENTKLVVVVVGLVADDDVPNVDGVRVVSNVAGEKDWGENVIVVATADSSILGSFDLGTPSSGVRAPAILLLLLLLLGDNKKLTLSC